MNKEEKDIGKIMEEMLNRPLELIEENKKLKKKIDKLQKEIQKLKEIKQTCYEDIDNIRNEYDKEIDKLQKEIKNAELKGIKSGTTIEYIGKATYWRKDKIEKYFISKDIIRDKIKELEEQCETELLTTWLEAKIEVLKELLGE